MGKRIRFNSDDDLALLRQVLNQNVLQEPEQWDAVRENLIILTKKEFSVRSLKDHLKYLMDLWRKKDAVNRVRSGVEEIFSERDNLLQEICDISRTVTVTPKKLKKTKRDEQQSSEIGVALRDLTAKYYNLEDAQESVQMDISIDHEESVTSAPTDHDYNCVASTFQEETADITSNQRYEESATKKQILGLRKSGLSFIQERSEREHNIRLRELKLEEEKLQLEKKKVELQERQVVLEERKTELQMQIDKKRFEEEISDRNSLRETVSAQRELIQTLLEQLKEK